MGDVDHAVEDAERRIVERAAHALVAFAVFGEVAHVQVVVADLAACEQLYAAEGEVGAFAAQFAVHIEAEQVAARLQGVEADAAVARLLHGGLCHLRRAALALKPQGNVHLRAIGSVHGDDRQLRAAAARAVVNPEGAAAVFAGADVDARGLQAARGEVDVERGDVGKVGVVGDGKLQRVGLQGNVQGGKGGIVEGEQVAVGGIIVAEVFADGVGQVELVVGVFDAAGVIAQGIERRPAPHFAAAQVAHGLPAAEGLLLQRASGGADVREEAAHQALRAAPVSSPRKSA